MERKVINDAELEKVVGGSIVFNEDLTACGYNRNDQYKILDFDATLAYLQSTVGKMSEKQQLKKLVAKGLIVPIE